MMRNRLNFHLLSFSSARYKQTAQKPSVFSVDFSSGLYKDTPEMNRSKSGSSINSVDKIHKAALSFLMPLTIDEVYATVVGEALKLLDAEYGSILLDEDGELKRVYATIPLAFTTKTRKKGYTHTVFKEQRPIVAHISDTGKAHPQIKQTGIKSTVFIPLSYQSKPIGVLVVNSTQRLDLTQKDLNVLKLFGSLASLAIKKNQLYTETQHALETRDLFISLASHELRTPLTSINGYVQLLYGKMAGKATSEAKWVEHLSWECLRLTNLVRELLEINRIRSGNLDFFWKECDLVEIVKRALDSLKFTYPKRKIAFNDPKNLPILVIGDFDKLLQCIINVVDNAVKFSKDESPIYISLKIKPSKVVISVRDEGQGIKRQDLKKIFDGFYKGKDNLKEGLGLGLYLTRNIIKQHHGKINVFSKVEKGASVEIELPKLKI